MAQRKNNKKTNNNATCQGKRQKKNNVVPFLHDEIIFNVLTWISAQVLYRSMRCVDNLWASIICNPLFIKTHLQRSKPGLFLQSQKPPYSSRFLEIKRDGEFELTNVNSACPGIMLNSIDGVALFHDPHTHIMYVANPVTMQGIAIPAPTVDLNLYASNCGLARNPHNGEYKLAWGISDNSYEAHFYTCRLGVDNCWRKINSSLPLYGRFMNASPISIRGFLFWTAKRDREFVVMDTCDESIRVLRLPRGRTTPQVYLKMGDYLSSITRKFGVYLVHILKDVRSGTWIVHHKLNYTSTSYFLHCDILSFTAWISKEQELIMWVIGKNNLECLAYNIKTRKIRCINGYITSDDYVQEHTNSLISWKPV